MVDASKILDAKLLAAFEKTMDEGFCHEFQRVSEKVHANAIQKGWWETERNDGELIALMHSELSEALEALRYPGSHSDHIPDFLAIEEELADTIIRILDYSAARKLRLGEAIVAKIAFNATRPHKHGSKAF